MNAVAIIRIVKLVALFGFFMPWMVVSCSGQPILSASGLDLAIGSLNFHNPMNGQVEHHSGAPNLFILAAAAAALGGLAFSFSRPAREAIGGLAMLAGAGLALAFIGFQLAKSGITRQLTHQAAEQRSDISLQGLLAFQMKEGFTVTWLAFAAALAVALFAIWSRRNPQSVAMPGPAAFSPRPEPAAAPAGPEPTVSPMTAACCACGTPAEAEDRFCSGCGAALA